MKLSYSHTLTRNCYSSIHSEYSLPSIHSHTFYFSHTARLNKMFTCRTRNTFQSLQITPRLSDVKVSCFQRTRLVSIVTTTISLLHFIKSIYGHCVVRLFYLVLLFFSPREHRQLCIHMNPRFCSLRYKESESARVAIHGIKRYT